MANKEIHYMSDNGTMFWPATTTTAIIDPTSREILSDILNKKVSVGVAGNIPSTVLPPIILESIATVSTNLTINATLIGKTYFCPDLEKIRHFYALEVNQSFQTTPEDTDPSPEITYYDKETDKFYRWDATTQGMVSIVAETSSEEPTFLNINLADLESDTVSTSLTEYYPSLKEDHLPSSTFEDSEGKYKNVIIRIRVLEEDNPEGMSSENIDENYWNFSLKLTPLALETTDNAWNNFNNFLFGSYTYHGTTYSAFISKFINNTGYTYYIQKIKLENLGTITSLPAYGDVPVYPTAGDNINIAFGKINRIVQSHEEVTAKALLDLNSRIQNLPSGNGGGIQEITWSALKTLRDGGNLTPGKFYRITNYTCTTTQTNTQSAGHVFDIIVLALSESTLSETAWASHHEGDTYFSNSNLSAWELKYCLDNDTTRFDWADTTNGKGVIYWMRDEYNNECPYDFKNIQYTNVGFDTSEAWYTFSNNVSRYPDHSISGVVYNNYIGSLNHVNTSASQRLNNFVLIVRKGNIICNNNIEKDCNNSYIYSHTDPISYNRFNACEDLRISSEAFISNNLEKVFGMSSSTDTSKYAITRSSIKDCTNLVLDRSGNTTTLFNNIIIKKNNNLTILATIPTVENIIIAEGVNESATVKTINLSSTVNNPLTIYKPANSVEISV